MYWELVRQPVWGFHPFLSVDDFNSELSGQLQEMCCSENGSMNKSGYQSVAVPARGADCISKRIQIRIGILMLLMQNSKLTVELFFVFLI